jgi:hypothetical protein
MQLFFGLLWLIGAIGFFAYEAITGEPRYRIRGLNISSGWFLLLLAVWNFARWYSSITTKNSKSLDIVRQARLREQRRYSMPEQPDPTFDFSDKPADEAPASHASPPVDPNLPVIKLPPGNPGDIPPSKN